MPSKTYQNSKDKYLKEKVDTFVVRVPKGKKDEISSAAKAKGLSLNAYVTALIFDDMEAGGKAVTRQAAKQSHPAQAKKQQPKKKQQKSISIKPETETKIPAQQQAESEKSNTKKEKMPSFLL